jgi:monomeric sarcosine oxidase
MVARRSFDVAVVGAGVFGAWTALLLQNSGMKVILLDAYGAANSRASSGGESRIIRMGYGADELYTRWAMRSFDLWQDCFRRAGLSFFHPTGVLWLARHGDPYTLKTVATLKKLGVRHKVLSQSGLETCYPQFASEAESWGILEPDSGIVMARRAVQAVVEEAVRRGVDYRSEAVASPSGKGRVPWLTTASGRSILVGQFIFACGPWLPKVFPDLLRDRIVPTRQEVFFFGPPQGDRRFAYPAMPAWVDFGNEVYGVPDLGNRGVKIGPDRHGPAFDPDQGDRTVRRESVAAMREIMGRRFPALKDAPLLEVRVCQYENTSNGDFLIDRHPDFTNVWLVGGGSGHGFKHGPAVGAYVATRLADTGPVEPRFTLSTKDTVQKRSVF